MAMTLDELKKRVEGEGLKYFIDPNRPALMLGAQGVCGRYQFVMLLELEGTFLQFRTVGYLQCPIDHPHLDAVLKVLGAINYRVRLLKYGWDPSDGEIVGYADCWLQDGTVTQDQFHRMVSNYLPSIDINYGRISKTLETGEDPGEASVLGQVFSQLGGSLPPELEELLAGKGAGAGSTTGKKKEKKKPDEPVVL